MNESSVTRSAFEHSSTCVDSTATNIEQVRGTAVVDGHVNLELLEEFRWALVYVSFDSFGLRGGAVFVWIKNV